jgi:hypothetical protein
LSRRSHPHRHGHAERQAKQKLDKNVAEQRGERWG